MVLPLTIQTLVSALSVVILVKTITMRSVPKTMYFLPLALAVFAYATGYLMEMDSQTFEGALFSRQIQYYGVASYAAFNYLFVRDFGNRPLTSKWAVAGLFALPVLVIALVYAWPNTRLFFADLIFVAEPTPHLVETRGPVYHVFVGYTYALILLSSVEILRHYPRATRLDHRARRLFLAATVAPSLIPSLLNMTTLPLPMQLGPASQVLALLILGSYILRRRAQDWLPFARERMVEHLKDGFVLLDNNLCYLDANEVAKSYFPSMRSLAPGAHISKVPRLPNDFLDAAKDPMDVLTLDAGQNETMLSVSATPVVHNGQQVCICVMFYDVTEQRKMVQQLEYYATHDNLTGLLSRGVFFKMASRDFDLALRGEQDVSLLMLDVDHFKQVNDTHGHQKGDEVLATVAKAIQERTRSTDICGRYGGEEFCIMLPATGAWGALRLANEVRGSVQALTFEGASGPFHVTVSVGVAPLDATRHTRLDDMVADADAALYQAKTSGRNRVVPYQGTHSAHSSIVSE